MAVDDAALAPDPDDTAALGITVTPTGVEQDNPEIPPAELPSGNSDSEGADSEEEAPGEDPVETDTGDESVDTLEENLPYETHPAADSPPGRGGAPRGFSFSKAFSPSLIPVGSELRLAEFLNITPKHILESLSNLEAVRDAATADMRLENRIAAMSAATYQNLLKSLDQVKEEMTGDTHFVKTLVGSAIAVSSSLTAGYVIWLLRSGILFSSVLSSMPAWRILDPLPILARTGDEDDPDDEESLETILKESPGKDDKKMKETDPP